MDAMEQLGMLCIKMKKFQKTFLFIAGIFFIVFAIILIKAARVPTPQSDTDNWGNILNEYLLKEHNASGQHMSNMSVYSLAIRNGRWLDVRAYGATGDGVTDDTAAIQAVINNAAINGGVVFFPAGDYLVSSSLILYSGVSLQGEGAGDSSYPGTRIIASNTLADSVIKYVSSDTLNETAIKDLQINAANQISGDGIFLKNIGELTTIDRVVVSGACNNGINIDLNFSSSIRLGYLSVNENGRCGSGAGVFINNSYSSNNYIEYLSGNDNQDALLKVRGLNTSNLYLVGFDSEKANASKQTYVIWLEAGERGNLIIVGGRINQSNPNQNGIAVLYNSIGGSSIGKFNVLGGIFYDEDYANYTWYYASDDSTTPNKSFINLNGRPFSQGSPYLEDFYLPQALELEGALKIVSGAIRPYFGMGSGIRFSNASVENDSWELTTSRTNSESVYWRHIKDSADERWFYMWDSLVSPFQTDAISFMPGGNLSSIISFTASAFGRVGIGKSTILAVSRLEVNGTITLNTTDAVPLIISRNTSAVACSGSNIGSIIYSSNIHYACNGTGWNALY